MDLTSYKKKVVIVYASVTGNTEELANYIYHSFQMHPFETVIYKIEQFPLSILSDVDVMIIGTYTWGNGEIPKEMRKLYRALEALNNKSLITAVFGTGDSFYPIYCGAVDQFRDMLYVQTNLAATLKVELVPQQQDFKRCKSLVEVIYNKVLSE
ncbi:flavodoxin domain-containing protein [Bacillus sp. 31A1R]|uniref:Flavodoxin domain-containing protein n=1 Tax=Robertmurraya mangrovi TaxID=3098077 RepID=A0ABU5J0K8_9BACI|nr:flavodoxin domain-containing protein [Bacillus sp. 31A1R]MDZ5472955.1 flavodoxin domain-containing protein [Bacillus sp. 31A1R]